MTAHFVPMQKSNTILKSEVYRNRFSVAFTREFDIIKPFIKQEQITGNVKCGKKY
jgi:hypothetical protein